MRRFVGKGRGVLEGDAKGLESLLYFVLNFNTTICSA